MTFRAPPPPGAATLERLAWKYRTLGELRRARARGEEIPERAVFRSLAAEFPGCLNELDTLLLEDIDARAEALGRAAEGGPQEDWMAWLAGYHALWRAALWLKRHLAHGSELDEVRAEALAKEASDALARKASDALARKASDGASVAVDADFVRAVAAPPEGRLNAVVLGRLSAIHDIPGAAIKRALFPRSKRP